MKWRDLDRVDKALLGGALALSLLAVNFAADFHHYLGREIARVNSPYEREYVPTTVGGSRAKSLGDEPAKGGAFGIGITIRSGENEEAAESAYSAPESGVTPAEAEPEPEPFSPGGNSP